MKTNMDYSKADQWIIAEKAFDSRYLGKCESIMCLGNGYMCIRSATEEAYLGEKRDFFVAGTFNKFDDGEVTELPNAADLIHFPIEVNGQAFSLEKGRVLKYSRELHLKTGELVRDVEWEAPAGERLRLRFQRIVSMKELHTAAQKITVTFLGGPSGDEVSLRFVPGIDGSVTNSGVQHFSEGDKRFYDGKYMQSCQTTTQSKIDFVFTQVCGFRLLEDGKADDLKVKQLIQMDRRKINCVYTCTLAAGKELVVEKISNVYTSRDREMEEKTVKQLQQAGLAALKESAAAGYDALAKESAAEWARRVWDKTPITIQSSNPMDQLAVRFAQYHLYVMTPAHDHRMNIGAKGLSGEGYKGHTFWDTDIFALPYFTFTDPEVARSLEEYRYLSLPGAHKKAKGNGYEGAQFPWESAWLDDGEVTPVWGAADIVTGQPTKIWSGFIEQHITADVAYGVWQYYMVTGDQDFMDRYGYELLMDTALFWASRLEWSEQDHRYHINDVVGPDEYKEHADDNAYTNYMAYWNIGIAIRYYNELKEQKPQIYKRLNEKMGLDHAYEVWQERKERIYLPKPRQEDLVIAQDAKYLTYPVIDLTKYKEADEVGTLFREYNLEQVNRMQVSKQADIMILFFLMEDLFSLEVKRANWDYYEPKTLHDSSLSLSTHVILASDMKDKKLAYSLFERAVRIDAGENMKSSDAGIHAASIAGIWQSVVYGFGGVRMLHGELRICPMLPDAWSSLEFTICWQGQKLAVQASHDTLCIKNMTGTKTVEIEVYGEKYQIADGITVNFAENG